MDDTISRQEAIKEVHKAIYEFFDICEDDQESPMTYKDKKLLELNKAITTRIKQLPSAERHGRWEKITNDWVDDAQYICSCCGRLLTVSNRLTELVSMSYPYCHCGAKMDEVTE